MLPKDIFDRGMKLAQGSLFFGVPLESFTKDELMAIAAMGWHEVEVVRKDGAESRDLLHQLHKARW